MATKTKEASKEVNKAASVVADASSPEFNNKGSTASPVNSVYVASSLQNGITFTGLTTVEGGRLTVPGVNNRLHGQAEAGILADGGSSVLVQLSRDVWDEIKAKYANIPAFVHQPPFLREFKSDQDYRSATAQSELKEVRTGAEPLTNSDLAKRSAAPFAG